MFDPEQVKRFFAVDDFSGKECVYAEDFDLLKQRHRAAMKFIMSIPAKNGFPGLKEIGEEEAIGITLVK